uniref:HTH_Tnp_ISL3 domain-containing protein n=1 Tax=Angiostrongylus cantonensis TaxID=6313 RepID=A0A0K0DLM2_ANGCA
MLVMRVLESERCVLATETDCKLPVFPDSFLIIQDREISFNYVCYMLNTPLSAVHRKMYTEKGSEERMKIIQQKYNLTAVCAWLRELEDSTVSKQKGEKLL